MRRPDPDRSTAILIGTSAHQLPTMLEDLPAVRANLADLARVLTSEPVHLAAPGRCLQFLDVSTAQEAALALQEHCSSTEDLLLVYFAGHGLLGDNGELFLALSGTDPRPQRLKFSALPFEWVRDAMLHSPARTRVLILDCCFAGRAIGAMSPRDAATALADGTEVEGAFTLTATSDTARALAPPGEAHTVFTGALLQLLTDGPLRSNDRDTDSLTLGEAYRHLAVTLQGRNLPTPQQRNTNRAADLVVRAAPDASRPETDKPEPEVPRHDTAPPPAPSHVPVQQTFRRPRTTVSPLVPMWARFWATAATVALPMYLLYLERTIKAAIYGLPATTLAVAAGVTEIVGALALLLPRARRFIGPYPLLGLPAVSAFVFYAITDTSRSPYPMAGLFMSFLVMLGGVCLLVMQGMQAVIGNVKMLTEPMELELHREGMRMAVGDLRAFVHWHELQQVTLRGDILVASYKPGYRPPSGWSPEAASGGYRIVDLRWFREPRAEVLRAIAHYAGVVYRP